MAWKFDQKMQIGSNLWGTRDSQVDAGYLLGLGLSSEEAGGSAGHNSLPDLLASNTPALRFVHRHIRDLFRLLNAS